MTLASKIQYKNYEPGEFLEKKERTYEETIEVIGSFPWEEQRDHFHVDLTSPSVTIEDKEGNYLKLALYYEGKFVLYYLNADKQLFTKSLTRYEDAYPYLNAFYTTSPFDTGDFKKEINWLRRKSIHFKNGTFEYRLNETKFWLNAAIMIAGLVVFAVAGLGMLLFLPPFRGPGFAGLFILFLLTIFGIYTAAFFNNYRAGRKKVLILSKGNPVFYYGWADHEEKFDKRNIRKVTSYYVNNRRNFPIGYVSIEIGPDSGRVLNIPNLVIEEGPLLDKLSGYPQVQKSKWFPFIPSASPVPF